MIAFGSLLLGLIVGPQPVELLVSDEVTSVEVLLDRHSLGTHQGGDWSLTADFGQELKPHELVAIAYDAEHREMARVRQWVNLPRRPAEAAIFIEGGEGGRNVVARLSWESVVRSEPLAVHVSFDGRPLKVDDPHKIPLPPHDPEQLHFLRAELDFSDNVSSVVEVSLAGSYSDRVNTELTAVPVLFRRGSRLPSIEKLQGRFSKRGESLVVVAVEKGPADLVIVKDREAHPRLRSMARVSERELRGRARLGNLMVGKGGSGTRRSRTSLPPDLRLRFLRPFPTQQRRTGYQLEVFPAPKQFTQEDGDLFWLLSHGSTRARSAESQRLVDAVAAAGLLAAGRNRRRAVVLIVASDAEDSSRFTAAVVRRYLEHLRVPLFVWSLGPDPDISPSPWREVVDVSSLGKLERAIRDLYRAIDSQRVIWLDGPHLPQDIVVSAGDLKINPSLVSRHNVRSSGSRWTAGG